MNGDSHVERVPLHDTAGEMPHPFAMTLVGQSAVSLDGDVAGADDTEKRRDVGPHKMDKVLHDGKRESGTDWRGNWTTKTQCPDLGTGKILDRVGYWKTPCFHSVHQKTRGVFEDCICGLNTADNASQIVLLAP